MTKSKSAATKKRGKANGTTSSSTSSAAPPTPTATPGPSMNRSESDISVDAAEEPIVNGNTPEEPPKEETPEEKLARAERTKEAGNVAFKAKRYDEALKLYSEAVGLNPLEPTYLGNRAAAYMALKSFRAALADCQAAVTLQSSSPQAKTLVRLAKCQLCLGTYAAALSTIRGVLEREPTNAAALEMQRKISALEGYLQSYETARAKGEWAMARLSLDQAVKAQEAEGGMIPILWRIWRVDAEIVRGGWDAASAILNDALRLEPNSVDVLVARARVMFLSGKLPQSLQHVMEALRLDPGSESAQQLRKRIKDVERLKEEGNTFFKAGKLQNAVNSYTETLARIGDAPEDGKGGAIRATLLSNRATAYLKMNRHADAMSDIDASLALSPSSFKALRTRARLHLHAEKYDSAIADFNAALEQAQFEDAAADVKALRAELQKAEVALKRSKTKDYYKILNVARDCSESELKKAYRKESLIHHPDKGGEEEKFKLVAEAWAVLSDPEKRRRYDLGEDVDGQSTGMGGMGGGMDGMDLSELFSQFHGGGGFPGGGFPGGARRGGRSSFHSHSHGGGGPGFSFHM